MRQAEDLEAKKRDLEKRESDLEIRERLIEEKRQRDTLLQAARAASSARQETSKPTKSRKGFFTFLFGTRENDNSVAKPIAKIEDTLGDENDQLQYTDIPNEHDDGTLCGTQQSLDVTCIPPEVYYVARSHLASTLTKRENPNALRWGPGSRMLATDGNSSVIYVIAGLGEIAEFGLI